MNQVHYLNVFTKNEQNYIFEKKKVIYTTQYIHIFACGNFIFSNTRTNKSNQWTYFPVLKMRHNVQMQTHRDKDKTIIKLAK